MKILRVFSVLMLMPLLGINAAVSQGYVKPVNTLPKCLKRAKAPSGAEYFISPLKNFSYDVELTYKVGTSDLPLNLTIRRPIRAGKGGGAPDVKISRAIEPKSADSKIIVNYKDLKADGYIFLASAANFGPALKPPQIAMAIMRGEKVKVIDGTKSVEISLDIAKMQSDFKAIEPEMRKLLEDEKIKLCRNIYEFQE